MPMYVYKCDNCDRTFETRVTVVEGEALLVEGFCKVCGGGLGRPFGLNIPNVQMRGYSPAHSRFFRGMRKQKGRELKKNDE